MRHTFLAPFALAFSLLSVNAYAQEPYAKVQQWIISKKPDFCNMIAPYEGGAKLYVNYTVGTSNVTVVVIDPAFKSVKDGETYPVRVYFSKKGHMDDGWGDMEAAGLVKDNLTAIQLNFEALAFLKDFKVNDTFAITRDDDHVVVGSFDLANSAAAATKLEQCAREVHRENPADPFSAR